MLITVLSLAHRLVEKVNSHSLQSATILANISDKGEKIGVRKTLLVEITIIVI
ncbi:hypothetical protein [Limosilactobacillus reuteri]|uniref:hypothetical protein n=1 Tax=Limosilactobacillus reuteri TaxID=1598 RepID=UPI001E4CE35E|nr:hypothetical protein [Limosilactobacillus reuteri]MCC4341920.1 hypothetical protein [Limosilactobacillus reuteri]